MLACRSAKRTLLKWLKTGPCSPLSRRERAEVRIPRAGASRVAPLNPLGRPWAILSPSEGEGEGEGAVRQAQVHGEGNLSRRLGSQENSAALPKNDMLTKKWADA